MKKIKKNEIIVIAMTRESYSILKRLKNEAGRDIYNNNLREICTDSFRFF